jgi:hypothetical protein
VITGRRFLAGRREHGTEVTNRKPRHDLILVQVARGALEERMAMCRRGLAIGFCISADGFRRAFPRLEGAARIVVSDSGWCATGS